MGLQMFQMLTGINSIMYYAPAIFAACGFNTREQLLATGGTGVVNFLATFLAFWLMGDSTSNPHPICFPGLSLRDCFGLQTASAAGRC